MEIDALQERVVELEVAVDRLRRGCIKWQAACEAQVAIKVAVLDELRMIDAQNPLLNSNFRNRLFVTEFRRALREMGG